MRSSLRIYKWFKAWIVPVKGTITDQDIIKALELIRARAPAVEGLCNQAISGVRSIAAIAGPLDIEL